jgi:hypothetical protein
VPTFKWCSRSTCSSTSRCPQKLKQDAQPLLYHATIVYQGVTNVPIHHGRACSRASTGTAALASSRCCPCCSCCSAACRAACLAAPARTQWLAAAPGSLPSGQAWAQARRGPRTLPPADAACSSSADSSRANSSRANTWTMLLTVTGCAASGAP